MNDGRGVIFWRYLLAVARGHSRQFTRPPPPGPIPLQLSCRFFVFLFVFWVDSGMLVRGVSCIYASEPQSAKKSTSRWPIFGLVLATRGDVLCNMLAERGANKSI